MCCVCVTYVVVCRADCKEMQAAVADGRDDAVDSLTSSRALSSTSTSDLLIAAATVASTVPSVTSSVSVMIGRTEQVSANSESKVNERQYSVSSLGDGPQISTAGDGSVVLTLSYSPLTLDTTDHNATVDTAVISRTSDQLSGSEAQSSAANTDNMTQRFVGSCHLCVAVSLSE